MPINFGDLLTGLGALAVLLGVLALTYLGTRWYARTVRGGASLGGRYIRLHERVGMGGQSSLLIVEVNSRFYLVGVGENGINLLSELEGFAPESGAASTSKVPFGKLLAALMEKAGKRGEGGDEQSRQ